MSAKLNNLFLNILGGNQELVPSYFIPFIPPASQDETQTISQGTGSESTIRGQVNFTCLYSVFHPRFHKPYLFGISEVPPSWSPPCFHRHPVCPSVTFPKCTLRAHSTPCFLHEIMVHFTDMYSLILRV